MPGAPLAISIVQHVFETIGLDAERVTEMPDEMVRASRRT
jgi:hypothetical protein